MSFLWSLKAKGYRESTIQSHGKILRHLSGSVDLGEVESVLRFVAGKDVSEGRKEILVNIYSNYCQYKGISFTKPRYRRDERLPHVPLEEDVNVLIADMPNKISTFCHLIKETGARPGEAWELRWVDINQELNTVTINKPEKRSRPRTIKVSSQLVACLLRLPRRTEYIFKSNIRAKLNSIKRRFCRTRKIVAEKHQNPRVNMISFLSLRHFKASMEYHKTKDILHVKELLGHKNIMNTLIYTHLVSFEGDEWVSKVAKTVEEACSLVEAGFEYVTEMDGAKIFRKRK